MASRGDMLSMVRVRLDELMPFDDGATAVVDAANALLKPTDAYIEELLEDAINDVLRIAPLQFCVLQSATATPTESDGRGVLSLPSGYLRFAGAKIPSWKREVTILTPENSPLHLQQNYAPTQAGVHKPVVVLSVENGVSSLNLYPCNANENVNHSYVKTVEKGWTYTEDYCAEAMLAPIAWMCAVKVCSAMGNEKEAKLGLEQMKIALGS